MTLMKLMLYFVCVCRMAERIMEKREEMCGNGIFGGCAICMKIPIPQQSAAYERNVIHREIQILSCIDAVIWTDAIYIYVYWDTKVELYKLHPPLTDDNWSDRKIFSALEML